MNELQKYQSMLVIRQKLDDQSRVIEKKVWSVKPKLSDVKMWKAVEQKRRRYKEAVVDQWLVLSDDERARAIQEWKAKEAGEKSNVNFILHPKRSNLNEHEMISLVMDKTKANLLLVDKSTENDAKPFLPFLQPPNFYSLHDGKFWKDSDPRFLKRISSWVLLTDDLAGFKLVYHDVQKPNN